MHRHLWCEDGPGYDELTRRQGRRVRLEKIEKCE
jgi:hypothetical protein